MLNRRHLLGGGLGLAALGGLAACGKDSADAPEVPSDPNKVSGKVLHWTHPMGDTAEESWWKEVTADFNKTYPNVEVQVVVQPWKGRAETLTTAIASKTGPDVCYMIPDFMVKYANEDMLMDMSKVLGDEKDDFRESSLKAVTMNDTLIAAPMLVSVQTPVVNTEVMAKLGAEAPETMDDLEAFAKLAVSKGMTVCDYYAAPDASLNGTFYPFLFAYDGDVLTEDGKDVRINDEAGVEALTFLRKLADMKAFNPEALSSAMPTLEQSLFGQGKQPYSLSSVVEEVNKLMGDKVKIAPPLKAKKDVAMGVVGGWVGFKTAKDPEAAAAWVRHLVSKEVQEKFLKTAVFLSPRKSMDSLWEGDEMMIEKAKYIDSLVPGVLHEKSREMMAAISPHIQGCLLGKVDPKAALDAAAADVKKLLG